MKRRLTAVKGDDAEKSAVDDRSPPKASRAVSALAESACAGLGSGASGGACLGSGASGGSGAGSGASGGAGAGSGAYGGRGAGADRGAVGSAGGGGIGADAALESSLDLSSLIPVSSLGASTTTMHDFATANWSGMATTGLARVSVPCDSLRPLSDKDASLAVLEAALGKSFKMNCYACARG
jgi:hypothetical protein